MANTSVSLVDLDFETIKTNLKTYLKRSDSPFKDIDFEGSTISHLVDVLSYNTFLNSFYLNMVASEMFLDTAQLRDSIVSHAKELNYTPRSYRSAEAGLHFTVTPSSNMTALVVPKGTSFTSKVGSNNYSFTTSESRTFPLQSNGVFSVDLTIYEGSYVTDSFVYVASNTSQRFVLSNPTIDVRSIAVVVSEDNGSNVTVYKQATSLLGFDSTSKIYFLQAAENGQYEVVFGDGTIGAKPKNGATVLVEYRACSGELPNGARVFDVDGPISGQANISSITTTSIAVGGAVSESNESIKFNAPRHYQNQERAVTAGDFETLLLANFPELQAVSAYGGEDLVPPQYGKVFIAVDNFNLDGAPVSAKQKFYDFIKPRAPLSIDPVFVDPDFLFVEAQCLVRYNTNITTLQSSDIATLAKSAVSKYNTDSLSGFKKTLRYSKLVELINNSHSSILSADLYTIPYKKISPTRGSTTSFIASFGFPLSTRYTISYDDYVQSEVKAIYSQTFTFNGRPCVIQDDRVGTLGVYTASGIDKGTLLVTIGTVDYSTGTLSVSDLQVDDYEGQHIHIYANPVYKDIASTKNSIIVINDDDIQIDVEAVQE